MEQNLSGAKPGAEKCHLSKLIEPSLLNLIEPGDRVDERTGMSVNDVSGST